jgi:hypothetical protein
VIGLFFLGGGMWLDWFGRDRCSCAWIWFDFALTGSCSHKATKGTPANSSTSWRLHWERSPRGKSENSEAICIWLNVREEYEFLHWNDRYSLGTVHPKINKNVSENELRVHSSERSCLFGPNQASRYMARAQGPLFLL